MTNVHTIYVVEIEKVLLVEMCKDMCLILHCDYSADNG